MNENIPDILKYEDKEKFRRKLLIWSRFLALLLILSIFYFGFEQSISNRENAIIMAKYGDMGYCYLCGLKTGKSASCTYVPQLILQDPNISIENIKENIATGNTMACENLNNKNYDLNITE